MWERHGAGGPLILRFARSCKNCDFSCVCEKSQKSQGWRFFESQLRKLQKIGSLTSFHVTCNFSQFFVMLMKSQFFSGTLLPPLTHEFINFSKFCDFFNFLQFLKKSQVLPSTLLLLLTLTLINFSKFCDFSNFLQFLQLRANLDIWGLGRSGIKGSPTFIIRDDALNVCHLILT